MNEVLLELGYKKVPEFGSVNYCLNGKSFYYQMLTGKNKGKYFKNGETEDSEVKTVNEL